MEIKYQQGTIRPEEVMRFLALTGQCLPVCLEIIRNKEVARKSKEIGLTAEDNELQEFADNYRIAHGLCDSSDMLALLENEGLTEDDFENFCESAVLTAKLKSYLADKRRVEEYFINNRSEFDSARISVLLVREASLAKELLIQIAEEGADFHKLARKHSVDENTKYAGGYAGVVSRRMLPAEVSAKIFAASSGDIIGPFRCEDLFQMVLVEEVTKAELNDNVKEMIREKIFGEWLCQFMREGLKVVP